MPESRVQIEDAVGHRVAISSDGRFLTSLIPEAYQFYFHTIYDVPGVVAANTFMSLFNPVGSGKTVSLFQAEFASYTTGASSTATSMTAQRITAASGGSLVAANTINRFATSVPDPVGVVRTGNPTTTPTGSVLNAWTPPLSTGVGSGGTAYTSTPPSEGFYCLPGQGVSFSTAAGNTSQMWKINIIWAEF